MAKARRSAASPNRLNLTRDQRSHGRGNRSQLAGDKRFQPKDRSLGGDQVEGRQAVKELVMAGKRRVKEIWISDAVERVGIIEEILDSAFQLRIPVATVSRSKLDNAAGSEGSQGILAFAEKLTEWSLDDLMKKFHGVPPFLVVIDGVTDPYNLGAILRSADCAGVTGVVLPEHRSVHVTPAATKSAAGAIEHLKIAIVPGISGALQELSKAGIWSVGLDSQAPQTIFEVTLYDQAVALVLGAEGKGISTLARQRCDVLASIPQYGHIPSLNVSNAGVLAMFEVARTRANRNGLTKG